MKPKPTTVNKITRPTLPKVLHRTRLFRRLDQARRFPITWISGPPGSGKTTLVASYLDQRKLPCLWYRVDEGDADLATFFYYLGLAGQKANPRSKKTLPLLTPEYQFGILTFTRRYFEALYQRLKPPYVLIFDNYQTIPAEALFHEIIQNGFLETPRDIQVIIISRTDPAPAFTRLQANNLLHSIDWEELRLTLLELKGMVKLHDSKPVSREVIQSLHTKTQGWTAGVVLLEQRPQQTMGPSILNSRIPEAIFNYFAGEVFDRMDQEMQAFLLKTACLPRMTPLMAEQLTGNSQAGRILADLNRKNYFISRQGHAEPVYDYHPLYRDFLLLQSGKLLSAEQRLELQLKAAGLLEQNGQTEAAVSLLHDMGDWQTLAGIVLTHAPEMLNQGRHRPLQEWLESLPITIRDSNPWLLYWQGMSIMPFSPTQARLSFEKAFAGFQASDDDIGAMLAISGVIYTVVSQYEDFAPLDHWYVVLNDLANKMDAFPNAEIEAAVVANLSMAQKLREIGSGKTENWEERALKIAETPATIYPKLLAIYSIFWHRLFNRGVNEALPLFQEFQRISRLLDNQPMISLIFQNTKMMYHLFTGLHDELMAASQEALETANQSGIHFNDGFFYNQTAASFISRMDYRSAKPWLDKISSMTEGRANWVNGYFHFQLARIALIKKEHEQALSEGKLTLEFAIKTGSPISAAIAHLLLAQVLLNMRNHREALEHLEQVRSYAVQKESNSMMIGALMIEAQFAFDQGDDSQGRLLLGKSLALAREGDYLSSFFDDPCTIMRMCEKALEAGIEIEHARKIIRRRGLMPEKPPVHIADWPWPVKIYTLGKFEVVLDDRPIQFPRKTPKKQLEALKVLLAADKKGINVTQLMDTLWPQADGDLANQSLAMTLRRLRHLIGQDDIFLTSEGRLALNPQYCWVDAWAFEQMLAESEKDKQNRESDRLASGLLEKALSFYEGLFLPDDLGQPWADFKRERLRNKFIRGLEKLGRYWEQAGDPEKAATFYLQGLETDDLAEEFYRHLMAAYAQMGRLTEIIRIYQRCEKTFATELGVAPSAQTQAMYKTLVNPLR
jgi:ATP/maltotriose-dependent transcriptional regulator MalT/DNA-binding SARP family transcriptional activator